MTRRYQVVTLFASGALLAVSGALMAGEPGKTSATAKPVTFTKDIAPIFQDKCEACHRKDSMAPMSLVTYEEARPWARSIKERVVTHQMPPWHLDKRSVSRNSERPSLSDEQIATIVRWVDSGSPMGDPKDMPPAKQWPNEDEWQLAKQFGEPDLILKSDQLHHAGGKARTSGGSRSPMFGSPSRAGFARWKCARPRAPAGESRITPSGI